MYWTRKQRYAFNDQIVCDDLHRILFSQVGWPGSVFDCTCLSKTSLIKNSEQFFSPREYLIGDSAYILSDKMVVPYKGKKATIPENILFNERFSKARVVIEHVMGMLKCRFSSLKGIRSPLANANGLEKINRWVVCIMILHNITLVNTDNWDEEDIDVGKNSNESNYQSIETTLEK